MKEPKSLEDFNQMSILEKTKWIRSMPGLERAPGGIVADPALDIMFQFKSGSGGLVEIIRAEKLTEVVESNRWKIMAERAMRYRN